MMSTDSTDYLPAIATATVPATAELSTTSWANAQLAYIASLDSENTRRAYRRHLDAFATAAGIEQLRDVTPAHLIAWRAYVTRTGEGNTLAPASQAQALAALRGFLRWAGALGGHTMPSDAWREALRTPRGSTQRPYSVLTDAEVGRMLASATSSRDRAVLAVMLGAGLRASEVVALDAAHVLDGEGGVVLYVEQGKGRKDRTVPVQPDVATILRDHMHEAGLRMGDELPLFTRADRAGHGGRLTTRAVGQLVDRVALAAGVKAKACSPHTLRHTYALRALRAGAHIMAVSKLLGHANVATTQRYLDHLELDELREAVPALPVAGGELVAA